MPKKIKSLFKWGFYRFGDNIVKDLDMCYDNSNSFVSVSYNRKSSRIVRKNSNYDLDVDWSFNIGNIMTILYECTDFSDINEVLEENLGFYCKNAYGFILADLNLVRAMPIRSPAQFQ
jgi:hypothetical protein